MLKFLINIYFMNYKAWHSLWNLKLDMDWGMKYREKYQLLVYMKNVCNYLYYLILSLK